MPAYRSLLAVTGLVLGAAVALPAAPAQAAGESYAVPANGVFAVEGHGWGHGHGMSQEGAQGAASLGRTADQIMAFYYPGTTRTSLAASSIRVLVSADTGADTQVFAAGSLAVKDVASGATATLPAGPTRWRAVTDAGGLHLQSYSQSSGGAWKPYALGGRTTLTGPVQFSGPSLLRLQLPDGTSRDYRGTLRAVRTSATAVQTVDVLSMESYLLGVVPREASSSWKPAALQAQAIAARTYSAENRMRYATSRSYDICDSTQCQVYGGAATYTAKGTRTALEPASTTEAVNATRGVIRTYQGKPIFAQFSASNGGWTTAGDEPYLPAQRDDWDGAVPSTVHSWTATLTAAQLQARYPAVGRLLRLRVTQRDGNGEWGGRVKAVVLEGVDSAGRATSVTTTGVGIYNAHTWPASGDGLRSSWWHIRASQGSAVVSQSNAPTLVQSPGRSTGTLTATLRNTGGTTWSTAGLHLAVSAPAGDADPLVGGSRTPGVYTGSASSIEPGGTASFSFGLTGDAVPVGVQGRSYRLAIGSGALFGATVSWRVPVAAPVLTAAVAAHPVGTAPRAAGAPADQPGAVSPGGSTVTVPVGGSTALRFAFTNTGNVTWPATGVGLGVSAPRNGTSASRGPSWYADHRAGAFTAAVAPGATGTVDATLYGNGQPVGVTHESFEPVWDDVHWLDGARSDLAVVRVDPSVARAAVLDSAPTTVKLTNAPSGTTTVRLRLRNVGGGAWTVGSEPLTSTATSLATRGWTSSTAPPPLGANASRPGADTVYPGEVGEWDVPLSAYKRAAGTSVVTFSPRGYGPATAVRITVADAVLRGSVTRVGPTVTVPRGGTAGALFEVKNTGNVAWPVHGAVQSVPIGSSPSHAGTWISATRIAGISGNVTRPGATTVAPGEVARFRVTLAGNGRTARTTSEQVGVVWDGWRSLTGLRARLAYRIA